MGNNNNSKVNIYLASSWFTPRTKEILGNLEKVLDSLDCVSLYSPRRDGIMLPPDQKHDTALRESIFKENVTQIKNADLVLANIDSVDSYNDPGTIYEVGYAMANNIPVVGYAESEDNIISRFKGIMSGFEHIIIGMKELLEFLEEYTSRVNDWYSTTPRVLFVGAGNEDVDTKLASIIIDSNVSLRWIDLNSENIYARIDEIFTDVDCMIAVIDDRKTIPSYMIGQAYARGIPVVTYSDMNYGINIMLLVSVLTHLKGANELSDFLQKIKREGIDSIPKLDISEFNAM